jgi:hypothetical protein
MSITETFTTWNEARKALQDMRRVQKRYIGREVIEHQPSGMDAIAIITHMSYAPEVMDGDGTQGAWLVGIRYLRDGSQTWTMCHMLTLTGKYYDDINAAVKLNPLYESMWS